MNYKFDKFRLKQIKKIYKNSAIALVVIVAVIISVSFFKTNVKTAQALAANGIYGNGTSGISIDINSSPYTDFAEVPTWGQYAYCAGGCAWFASSRVKELTGYGTTIYSGTSWYNTRYLAAGFLRGSTIKVKSLACYANHVAVVEAVDGDTVTVSEGGYTPAGADYGYCIIHTMSLATLESDRDGAFLGYVYLSETGTVISTISPTATVIPTATAKATATPKATTTPKITSTPKTTATATTSKSVGRVKIKVCSSRTKKKITVKWKKLESVNHYQISYSTNKNMSEAKVKKSYSTATTLLGLTSGKKYYVYVRAVTLSNSEYAYGKWSQKKKAKVR